MQKYYLELSDEGNPLGYPAAADNLKVCWGDLTDEEFLEKGYHLIINEPPEVTSHQTLRLDGYSQKEDGSWSWNYVVIDIDQDYLTNIHIRIPRDSLLKDCDWTVLPDSPLSAEDQAAWLAYRQELRDLTSGYPTVSSPSEVVWPTPPNAPSEAEPVLTDPLPSTVDEHPRTPAENEPPPDDPVEEVPRTPAEGEV